jgi:hypothetical protein
MASPESPVSSGDYDLSGMLPVYSVRDVPGSYPRPPLTPTLSPFVKTNGERESCTPPAMDGILRLGDAPISHGSAPQLRRHLADQGAVDEGSDPAGLTP